MCGACGGDSLVSYRDGDVVEVTSQTRVYVGRVEEIDKKWGVAVIDERGRREWYALDLWCPMNFDTGFSVIRVDASRFVPDVGFRQQPPDIGRGWLQRPPARRWPRPAALVQAEQPAKKQRIETDVVDECIVCDVEDLPTSNLGAAPSEGVSAACAACPTYLAGGCAAPTMVDSVLPGGCGPVVSSGSATS